MLRSFFTYQQQDVAGSDWLAGVVGIFIRSVSLAKSSGKHLDTATLVEHSAFVCVTVLIIVSSLSKQRLYVRSRNIFALGIRLGAILMAHYVYEAPLHHPTSQDWDGTAFGLKVAMASRALPLALTSFVLPVPLYWLVFLQPLSLLLIARKNTFLCTSEAVKHPSAQRWFEVASRVVGAFSSVGVPCIAPADGYVCKAFVLWLQLSVGLILPSFFLLKGESQRFVDWKEQHRHHCSDPISRLYQTLHDWLNSPQHNSARWAVLYSLLAVSWVAISLWFS